jgi:HEAT repeat protein
LKDPELEVRVEAVKALGKFKNPDTFEDMADVLLEDAQIEARQAAATAFGGTSHPGAVPYLMLALRDPFWWYEREQAVDTLLEAIQKLGVLALDPLLEALSDGEGTVRRYAARLLGRLQDPRVLQALGLALYDTHFEVGKAAAESLAGFGPPGLKILAEALRHPEAWLRQHAIAGLALSGDQRILPVILDMLKDPDREVQKQAILALGALNDARALPSLQAIAVDRRDRELSSLARESIKAIQNA